VDTVVHLIHCSNNDNMPHTTTKVQRLKRPDYRPNEKMRRKMQKEVEDAKTIQDLRITSVQKGAKKQRVAQVTPLRTIGKNEKVLRALRKKLNSINDLMEKEKNGVELDEQQLQKVASLEEVMAQLSEFVDKNDKKGRKRSLTGSDDESEQESGEED